MEGEDEPAVVTDTLLSRWSKVAGARAGEAESAARSGTGAATARYIPAGRFGQRRICAKAELADGLMRRSGWLRMRQGEISGIGAAT